MTAKLAAVEKESGEQLTALQEENLNLKQRLQVPYVRCLRRGTDFQPFTKAFVPTLAVLWIRFRRTLMFLGLLDPDLLVRGTDPDPSIMK